MKKLFYTLATFILLLLPKYSMSLGSIICPNDTTVKCGTDVSDLSVFGNARYHDANGWHVAGAPQVSYYLNGTCSTGYILRTWRIEDANWQWLTCTQRITIGSGVSGTFGLADITWPVQDTMLIGCDPNTDPSLTGRPKFNQSGCGMIAVNKKDDIYYVNDQCKKLIRTWKVIDWCQNSINSSQGTWSYTQHIKLVNAEQPKLSCIKDTTILTHNCDIANIQLPALKVDASSCGGIFEVTNDSPFATNKGANASGIYPVGTTKVNFTILYGCGQRVICSTNITVKSTKGPTPICINELAVALMGTDTDRDGRNDIGMTSIWAKDLNYKSTASCSGGALYYSFSPDSIVMSKTFTCEDLGLNKVRMYVSDIKGNSSFCEVNIDVQNNGANIKDCVRKPAITQPVSTTLYSITGTLSNVASGEITKAEVLIYPPDSTTWTISYDTTVVMKMDSFINFSGNKIYRFETDTVIKTIKNKVVIPSTPLVLPVISNTWSMNKIIIKNSCYKVKALAQITDAAAEIDKEDLAVLERIVDNPTDVQWTEGQLLAADINQDGLIDSLDIANMSAYLAGDLSTPVGKTSAVTKVNNNYVQMIALDSINHDITNIAFVAYIIGDIAPPIKAEEISLEERSIPSLTYTIYPNPTSGTIEVEIAADQASNAANFTLYDGQGRTILSQKLTNINIGQSNSIDLQNISNGMYYYRIIINGATRSGKIFKN